MLNTCIQRIDYFDLFLNCIIEFINARYTLKIPRRPSSQLKYTLHLFFHFLQDFLSEDACSQFNRDCPDLVEQIASINFKSRTRIVEAVHSIFRYSAFINVTLNLARLCTRFSGTVPLKNVTLNLARLSARFSGTVSFKNVL